MSCLIALAWFVIAPVKLRDAQSGATLAYTRSQDKDAIRETEEWVRGDTSKTISSSYRADGTLVHRTFTMKRGSATTTVDGDLDSGGAQVTTSGARGAASRSHIPLRSRSGLIDVSLLWFVKEKPAKGAKATFMSFDPEERYWQEVTVTFDGRGKIGKSTEGNLVTRRTARKTIRLLLDDKGMPLVWEEGRMRLVRE